MPINFKIKKWDFSNQKTLMIKSKTEQKKKSRINGAMQSTGDCLKMSGKQLIMLNLKVIFLILRDN